MIFEIKNIIIDCTKEIARLNRRERKEFFLNKIKSFKLVVTITGRYYYTWVIGTGKDQIIVCREGFEAAYNISSWYTEGQTSASIVHLSLTHVCAPMKKKQSGNLFSSSNV